MPNRLNVKRRGLAMLLVLVSLMMATIMATAYLASRDNSLPIGDNVESATAARWAALSALDTGVAILETETDWRTADPQGRLLNAYPLAGATVDLFATDITTGQGPTATSEYIDLAATATVDGVRQVATGSAYVPTIAAPSVAAVDLTEFAIFARDALKLTNRATLARWPTAPLSPLGRRLYLGTRATSASRIEILGDAASIDTTLYHGPGASGLLLVNESSAPVERVELSEQIPMPAPPAPTAAPPDGFTPYPDLDVTTPSTVNADGRWRDIEISTPAGLLTLEGDILVVAEDDLRLLPGSGLVIDGNVEVVVFDDLELSAAAIELKTGATLTLFVGDDADLTDSYIGDERPDDIRDNSGSAPYIDLLRLQIFSIDTTSESDRDWDLLNNSVIKASFFGPTVDFDVRGDSALYGRVAAMDVYVANNGAIFYDPALDERRGFANPQSAIFELDGSMRPEFSSLASLDPADLSALADGTQKTIRARGVSYEPSGPPPPPPPPPPPDQPTPRVVDVDFSIDSFGTELIRWEHPEEGGGGGGGGGQELE
ncbi:MAG: hypothetical protein ACYS0G_14075 [Planctomycetota bacterium]|jgi:hypothetical protein